MKITKKKLENIIKEELNAVLDEVRPDDQADRDYYAKKAKEERKKKMAKLKAARNALTDVVTQIDKGSYGPEQSEERIKSKEKFLKAEVARLEKELGLRNEQMTPDEAADATFDFRDELESKGHGCVDGASADSITQYKKDLEKHGDKAFGALIWWCGNSTAAQKSRKKHAHYPGLDKLEPAEQFAIKLLGDYHGAPMGRGSIAQKVKNTAKSAKDTAKNLRQKYLDFRDRINPESEESEAEQEREIKRLQMRIRRRMREK